MEVEQQTEETGGATGTPGTAGGATEQQTAVEQQSNTNESGPIAGQGGEKTETVVESAEKPYWPDDWRDAMARHHAGEDEKAYKRELKRLERIKDPAGLFGMYRDAESKISSNRAIFKPEEGASEEDIKAYHKALGVPENPEDYIKDAKTPNGADLSEQDYAVATDFAKAMHQAGAPKPVMDAALSWYFQNQEAAAEAQDEHDERVRYETERELKEEFGAKYKATVSSIASLFAQAPGGSDLDNEDGLYSRLIGGRLADGTMIGDDPDVIRFLSQVAQEINPAVAVMPEGFGGSESIDAEINKIEGIMRTNRREYNQKYAARYQELLAAREKIRAKA